MRTLRPLVLLCLAAVLSGCFQTKALIRLNADGSGTVEETVLMNSMFSMGIMEEFMEAASEMDGSIEIEDEAYEMAEDGPYSVQALRERAAQMGATLQSVEGADILFGSGYTAVYAFDDINGLQLSTNALGDAMGSLSSLGGGVGASGDEGPVTFAYTRGQLTVRMPEPVEEEAWEDLYDEDEYVDEEYDEMDDVIGDGEIIDEPYFDDQPAGEMEDVIGDGEIIDEIELDFDDVPPPPAPYDPKKAGEFEDYAYSDEFEDDFAQSQEDEMRAMAVMFKDMRMTIEILLPADVRETNALYAEGRTLTLVDMDFGLMMESPDAFEQLEALDGAMSGPPTLGMSGLEALKDIPGFRFESSREVTVSF